ncbi:hypothetical protein G6F31_015241 [Rhizopus arrhizus]|nr:hypothetical protein G6F31_015241 [Rhizopus arrhizus]
MPRHPNWWIRTPPSSGPAAPATAPTADQAASIRLRTCSSSYAWVSSLKELGMNSAAPTPCSMRAAISESALGARPQSSDASVNTPKPLR